MTIFDTGTRTAVIRRIESLTQDSKARWGKMAVDQMICHCADGARMPLAEIETAETSNLFTRTGLKWLAIYALPMPKSTPTLKEIDQAAGAGTAPSDIESDKKTLIALIKKIADAPADFAWNRHGIFGEMTKDQWGRLIYKHLDHHLKQFGV